MLLLVTGALFLPQKPEYKQTKPEDLLYEIIQPTRYVTTDQVAKMIIDKDPSLELVDVRDVSSFEKFSLTNAVNIPLDSILSKSNQDYFGISGMKVVFYSNDDIKADEAWVLTRRMGYEDTYVMTGGLNCWIETIINPEIPSDEAPYTAFERYEFRRGAQMYFIGVNVESKTTKAKVTVHRKKKEAAPSGGC